MRVLHGSWLDSAYADQESGLVLWAETSEVRPASGEPGRPPSKRARSHPFSLSSRNLREAWLDLLPAMAGPIQDRARESTALVHLPSTSRNPQASPALAGIMEDTGRGQPRLAAWQVDVLIVPPADVPGLLIRLPSESDTTPGVKIGADLCFWARAMRLVMEMLAGQRYIPALVQQDGRYLAIWQPLWDSPADRARLEQLAQGMPPICRAIASSRKGKRQPPAPRALLENCISLVLDAFVRGQATYGRPRVTSPTSAAEAWLAALVAESPVIEESPASLARLYNAYRAWTQPLPGATAGDTFRLCFRLEPPPAQADASALDEPIIVPRSATRDWTLRYLLQATDDPSLLVPAEAVWRERGGTLRFLNRIFDAPQERLLAGLGQASRIFPPIETSLRTARPEGCALNAEQAYTFIRETSLLLQSCGFGVLVPDLSNKLGVRVRLRPRQAAQPKGGVAGLSFDSIVQYDWQLALGGEPLSRRSSRGWLRSRCRWCRYAANGWSSGPSRVEQAIRFWEKRKAAGSFPCKRLAPGPGCRGRCAGGLPSARSPPRDGSMTWYAS